MSFSVFILQVEWKEKYEKHSGAGVGKLQGVLETFVLVILGPEI